MFSQLVKRSASQRFLESGGNFFEQAQRECSIDQLVLIGKRMTCTCVLHLVPLKKREVNKFKVLWRTYTRLCTFLSLSKLEYGRQYRFIEVNFSM